MSPRTRIALGLAVVAATAGGAAFHNHRPAAPEGKAVASPASTSPVAERVAEALRRRAESALAPALEGEPSPSVGAGGDDPSLRALSRDELREEADYIDAELTRRDAITRLNRDEATTEERTELGNMIERFTLLRHELVRRDVEELAARVGAYEEEHGARMAKALGVRP